MLLADRFSKINELNTLNMKLELMFAKMKIKLREMGTKTKQLNDLKLNIAREMSHIMFSDV